MIATVLPCVVTYEPDADSIRKIKNLREQVPRLLLLDNSVCRPSIESVAALCTELHIFLKQNKMNVGQAEALNQACMWGRENGYQYVLLFDQDTKVLPGFFNTLLASLKRLPGDLDCSVVGCAYIRRESPRGIHSPEFSQRKTVITSASFFSLSLCERVGGFRSDYFIDHVDDEFCLRVRRADGKVWQLEAPLVEHKIGNWTKSRWSLNHSPLRWYYMTRNHIWTVKEYFFFDPVWCCYSIALKARFLLGTLFNEEDLLRKMLAMVKGAWVGLTTCPANLK